MLRSIRVGVVWSVWVALPASGLAQDGSEVYGAPPPDQAAEAATRPETAPVESTAPATVTPPAEDAGYLTEDEAPRNNVFGEAFGAGLWYSINYERILVPMFAVRVGFSFLSASFGGVDRTKFLSVPVTAHLLLNSSSRNQFDLNLGATLIWASNLARLSNLLDPGAGAVVWGTAGLGYRIQPRHTGFHFRIGGGALFGKGLPMGLDLSAKRGLLPWIYVGAGASF